MKKFQLLAGLYILSILIIIAGALLKILHMPGGDSVLIASFLVTVAFMGLVLQEVFSSARISTGEKLMWTVGMVFFNSITGIVYLLVGRKKVVAEELPQL